MDARSSSSNSGTSCCNSTISHEGLYLGQSPELLGRLEPAPAPACRNRAKSRDPRPVAQFATRTPRETGRKIRKFFSCIRGELSGGKATAKSARRPTARHLLYRGRLEVRCPPELVLRNDGRIVNSEIQMDAPGIGRIAGRIGSAGRRTTMDRVRN